MVLYRKRIIAVFVSLFLLTTLFLASASAECFSTVWPHEKSDLKPDPALVFGRLENGFRYILMKNSEPRDRVAMSLYIEAGSLNEASDQRGIAHFLEHMLFNGSTHFKPGELVEYFQSIGMSFGGDTNAHTTYNETVYDIILPHGTAADIEKGLLVFSDYARGALLLQTEIERERGVILAEKRSRDSAGYRAHVKELEFAMQGTMIPERMPIGTLETLNKADNALMKAFYDDWYRPENIVLVMVGDFEPNEIKSLVEKQFSSLKGSGDQPPCPEVGSLNRQSTDFFYHYETEMGITETSIEALWNVAPVDDSLALEVRELTEYVANKIMQYRLDDLARKSDTPFTEAKVYSGIFLRQIAYAEIGAKSDPDKWKESLEVIENSLRQALEFGFTEAELLRVKKELLAELDSAVLTATSRDSKHLAASIVRSLSSNRVIQSPQQEKSLITPALEKMRLVDVEERFRDIWSHSNRIVKVNGNAVLTPQTAKAEIKASYEGATAKKVFAYKGEAIQEFPYLRLEDKHPVVSQVEFADIDAKRFVFANGVILNLKKTSFEENEIQVSADFGLGKSSEVVPGLSMLAGSVIGQSGTGTLSKSSLDKILAGSSVKLNFRVQPTSFSWQGKALNKDMELLFQVLQSLIADPGIEENAFQVSMDRFKQFYEGLSSDVSGVLKLKGESFLADGNPAFGLPSWDAFSQLNKKQIEEWFLPAAENSGLEISLVGDFDEKEVLTLVENYFSVLPKRAETEMEEVTVSFPEGKTLALTVPSSIDKGMLVVAWKTDDFWDIHRTRGLHLLAGVFSDKMRQVIREKLGASYSPQVYNVSSRIYKGYGVMQAILVVDPGQITLLSKEVLGIAEELWQGEIKEEELERAKGPMLTSLKDMVRSNGYWLQSVLALSSRYPQQLQWPQTILSGFASFSIEELRGLGRAYLDPQKAAVITVVPE